MSIKKLAVIFDTNSYRKIATGKSKDDALKELEEIIELEHKKEIQSFGSIIVGMEMLANLVEGENGFNYQDCLTGVILLSKHCNDKERNIPRMIPHVALLLEHSLFGEIKNKELEMNARSLAGTIQDFRDDTALAIKHHTNVNTFENIKNYIDLKEEEFSKQIEQLVEGAKNQTLHDFPGIDKKNLRIKTLNLIKSDKFLEMMSMALVKAIFDNLSEVISTDELSKKGEFLRNAFPLSAGFYQWITYTVVEKDIDLRSKASKQKRWNWLWDYNVSYAVSNSTVNQREVLFVTSDKDLRSVLKDFGFDNKVMTLEEYIIFLRTV